MAPGAHAKATPSAGTCAKAGTAYHPLAQLSGLRGRPRTAQPHIVARAEGATHPPARAEHVAVGTAPGPAAAVARSSPREEHPPSTTTAARAMPNRTTEEVIRTLRCESDQ